MNHYFGWAIIMLGAVIALIGVLILVVPHVPWLGRLPGDIRIQGENYRFYFPVTTCLLLSLVLSIVIWVARMFR